MRILVLAEHNNEELKPSTFSTINAANQIDSNVDVLVIGFECESVTKKLSNITNIKKVLLVDDIKYKNPIAENISPIILSMLPYILTLFILVLISIQARKRPSPSPAGLGLAYRREER